MAFTIYDPEKKLPNIDFFDIKGGNGAFSFTPKDNVRYGTLNSIIYYIPHINRPYKFNITATDLQNEVCYDILEVEVHITIDWLFKKIGKFIPAILGILGLLKYQDELWEFMFQNRYQYRRIEKISHGEFYEK